MKTMLLFRKAKLLMSNTENGSQMLVRYKQVTNFLKFWSELGELKKSEVTYIKFTLYSESNTDLSLYLTLFSFVQISLLITYYGRYLPL